MAQPLPAPDRSNHTTTHETITKNVAPSLNDDTIIMILRDVSLTWLDDKACRLVSQQWRTYVDCKTREGTVQHRLAMQEVVAGIRLVVQPLFSEDYSLTAYELFRTSILQKQLSNLLRAFDDQPVPNTFEKEVKWTALFFALVKTAGSFCLTSQIPLASLLTPLSLSAVQSNEIHTILLEIGPLFTHYGIIRALALNEACDEYEMEEDERQICLPSLVLEESSMKLFQALILQLGIPATIELVCNIRIIRCRNKALVNLMQVLKHYAATHHDSQKNRLWVKVLSSRIKQMRIVESQPGCSTLRAMFQLLALKA